MFYTCAASTMAFALYNVVVSGFLVVSAQGLTLRGPPNSVARCVAILQNFWPSVKWCLVCSVLSLVATACSIFWMKLEEVALWPASAVACTAIVTMVVLAAILKMAQLYRELAIDDKSMVRGDLNVTAGGHASSTAVDLTAEREAVIAVSSR